MEAKGRYRESLSAIDSLLLMENLNEASQRKPLLERAAYLCIVQKDYKEASKYQTLLVKLCEKLYLLSPETTIPHPLLGFHYYQLGKLLSQSHDYPLAADYLHKASLILAGYYGVKDSSGAMLGASLVHEVNENYLANVQLIEGKVKEPEGSGKVKP